MNDEAIKQAEEDAASNIAATGEIPERALINIIHEMDLGDEWDWLLLKYPNEMKSWFLSDNGDFVGFIANALSESLMYRKHHYEMIKRIVLDDMRKNKDKIMFDSDFQ